MADRIRIVVGDPSAAEQKQLIAALEKECDFEVVGAGGDGFEVTDLAQELQPDFLVVDLRMSGLGPFSTLRRAQAHSPATQVVVYTMEDNPAHVLQMLDAGVAGYVRKDEGPEEVLRAIHRIRGGTWHLSPSICGSLERRVNALVRGPVLGRMR